MARHGAPLGAHRYMPSPLSCTGWEIAAVTAMAWPTMDIVIFLHDDPVVDLSSSRKPLPTPQKP